MKIDKKVEGFTLIELLVVIAIIGILSTVVVASLGSARAKSKDSGIKAQLNQIRAQSSIYYDTVGAGKYTNMFSDPKISILFKTAQDASGGTGVTGADSNSWAAAVPLPYAGGYWCTDVKSFSGRVTTVTNVTASPASCN